MNYLFNSQVYGQLLDIQGIRKIEELAAESHFFSCSPEFIYEQDAPLHHEILNKLKNTIAYKKAKSCGLNEVIDSRITQTMTGMYPSIPGWHCDSVPRGKNGQPELHSCDSKVQHFMCLLSSTVMHTNTLFAKGNYVLNIDEDNVWKSVNREINKLTINTLTAIPGHIYQFDQQTLHCAQPTINNGWRLFFRLSFDNRPVLNHLRKQVNVYTPLDIGW